MERDYKKGFTLAEMLVVFLLISIMLAIFAPSMTKRAKRSIDPSCPGGSKKVVAEYSIPGNYSFTVPENIVPGEANATVTIVGAGGSGGNAEVIRDASGIVTSRTYGRGGQGGGCLIYDTSLTAGDVYSIVVGRGAIGGSGAGASSFNSDAQNGGESASVEADVSIAPSEGSVAQAYVKDIEDNAKKVRGGAAGKVCDNESCDPHGKPGSGYMRSSISKTGFIAGTGGGGGGFDGATGTPGLGGAGGDGYVRVEYKIKCGN